MSENSLRCPDIGCPGLIAEMPDGDEHFWMCGECGDVWYDRDELDEAIGKIISQFPYRKKVYRKSKGTWQPVPLGKEPIDYEELVEAELEEADGDADEDEVDGDVDEDDDDIWWTLACPVSKCDGTVFFDEDEKGGKYWVCDSCDSKWFDAKNLMKEIAEIIKKFPYRKQMYRKTKAAYEPVDWDGDIMEYCDLVQKEPRDKKAGKKRG